MLNYAIIDLDFSKKGIYIFKLVCCEQFDCYFPCNFINFLQNRFGAILQFSVTLRVYGRHFNCGEGLSRDTDYSNSAECSEINSIIVSLKLGYANVNNFWCVDVSIS